MGKLGKNLAENEWAAELRAQHRKTPTLQSRVGCPFRGGFHVALSYAENQHKPIVVCSFQWCSRFRRYQLNRRPEPRGHSRHPTEPWLSMFNSKTYPIAMSAAQTFVGIVLVSLGLRSATLLAMDPELLNAPLWVSLVGCGCFVLAGGSIVLRRRLSQAHQAWLMALLIAMMTVIPLWMVFSTSDGACGTGMGMGWHPVLLESRGYVGTPPFTPEPSGLACRWGFVALSLLMTAVFMVAVHKALVLSTTGKRLGGKFHD